MKTAFLSLAFVVTVTACATNPATGKRQFSLMSEEQEIAAGQQNDVEVRREMGVYDDRADRKSTRLNSSHPSISYAVFCLKKKKKENMKKAYRVSSILIE